MSLTTGGIDTGESLAIVWKQSTSFLSNLSRSLCSLPVGWW